MASTGWKRQSAAPPAPGPNSASSGRTQNLGPMAIGLSVKAGRFTESVIREMTRVNLARNGPDRAVNFAQGFPDFDPVPEIVEAAQAALTAGGAYHQYATTWGAPALRRAIAEKKSAEWGRPIDPETQITVACGS